MSEPDVVEELGDWLEEYGSGDRRAYEMNPELAERARDEIVELRARLDVLRQWKWSEATDLDIRHDALEEAARVCEGGYTTGSTASTLKAVVAAIRALKDKRE